MMVSTNKCLVVLLAVNLIAGVAHAAPQDEKEWLACQKDADCTSVELGCWYWQPINVIHSQDMKEKYVPTCSASVPAGPQPSIACNNHICINNYTVKYWKQLDQVPYKNVWIAKKMDQCLKDANLNIDWTGVSKKTHVSKSFDYMEIREPLIKKVDETVSQGKYSDGESLQKLIDLTISCDEVVAKAKSYQE
jgi:hypothetical protein